MAIKAIVMGASAGGVEILHQVLPQFPATIPYPLLLVQHNSSVGHAYFRETLQQACHISIAEAEDKMEIRSGHLYIAPANYHLLIENQDCLALSLDGSEHYCRPAIDPLFTSAADCFGSQLVGVIFSGMGSDGALGLRSIMEHGGKCMVQSPVSAPYPLMPRAALDRVADAHLFEPDDFYQVLTDIIALEKGGG